MKVKFLVNIGSRDAGQLGLDYTKCSAGSELSVSDDAADWLLVRGYAQEVSDGKKKRATTFNAVEPKPSVADAKRPEISE